MQAASTIRLRGWGMAVIAMACLEDMMANKDKGGRSTKKVATKDLKQKRFDKKTKKEEADRKSKSKIT